MPTNANYRTNSDLNKVPTDSTPPSEQLYWKPQDSKSSGIWGIPIPNHSLLESYIVRPLLCDLYVYRALILRRFLRDILHSERGIFWKHFRVQENLMSFHYFFKIFSKSVCKIKKISRQNFSSDQDGFEQQFMKKKSRFIFNRALREPSGMHPVAPPENASESYKHASRSSSNIIPNKFHPPWFPPGNPSVIQCWYWIPQTLFHKTFLELFATCCE